MAPWRPICYYPLQPLQSLHGATLLAEAAHNIALGLPAYILQDVN